MNRKTLIKIAVPILIAGILCAAFFLQDGPREASVLPAESAAPQSSGTSAPFDGQESPRSTGTASPAPGPKEMEQPTAAPAPTANPSPTPGAATMFPSPSPTASPEQTAAPTPTPTPALSQTPEPQEEKTLTCTLSIRCDTILNDLDRLDPDKAGLVPGDGVLLYAAEAAFEEGETVFDVLQRVCREYGIHLEFAYTPVYGSSYIEGIGNLYEFDCGELSGWMYKVNGWFPNFGCSQYALKDGDAVEWVYTCDLGNDVGGGMA